MSSGKKAAQQKAESNNKKAIAALTPKNYSDPWGSFNAGTGIYSPNLSQQQKDTRTTGLNKINDITSSIPTSLDVNSLFNNDFYKSFNDYYTNTLSNQRAQDTKTLNNNLAARNQLGSSYDAYNTQLLNKNYTDAALAAEAQARGDSANYYSQALGNQLNTLQGLRNDLINAQNYEYAPFNAYLGYQGAVSPLQQGQAQAYSNLANFYNQQAAQSNSTLGNIMRFVDPLNTMQMHSGNFGNASQGVSNAARTAANIAGMFATGGATAPMALGNTATSAGQYLSALNGIA